MKIIDEELLEEFRRKPCAVCGGLPPCEAHHIFSRGMGGGGRVDWRINLVSLCWKCHRKLHDGNISRKWILDLVAKINGTTPERIIGDIHWIKRLPKDAPTPRERESPPQRRGSDNKLDALQGGGPESNLNRDDRGSQTDEEGWVSL